MGFQCGIVGLPNVGKSTLFNALTKTAIAQAANYPFCTIEPNTGKVAVPDVRLTQIAAIAGSKEIIPTSIEFVDIAGLVRGASKGEGLGNKFLANIREINTIIHVLRCFEDEDITHVENCINPVSDAETVETELMLSDYESLERRLANLKKRANSKDPLTWQIIAIMEQSLKLLEQGQPARTLLKDLNKEEINILHGLNLLTTKPVLYVCNVNENDLLKGNSYSAAVAAMAQQQNAQHIIISAALESELAQLDDEEAEIYLASLGVKENSLTKLIRSGYNILDLITYFTCGPKETRAWTIRNGTKAPQAAGVIHSDFEKAFIRAGTIAYTDFINYKGEQGAKEAGKYRDEGKEYIVQDGDIIHFKHNC